jgi:hypothetical protein
MKPAEHERHVIHVDEHHMDSEHPENIIDAMPDAYDERRAVPVSNPDRCQLQGLPTDHP